MHGAICFIIGMMAGIFLGVVTMCLAQINRVGKERSDEYQND